MIALQLAGGAHNANLAARIIRRDGDRWLGDLALALARKGTEFRRGMLEIARAGLLTTPAWVWPKLEGHRELGTVRILTPAHVATDHYARLLRSTPNVRDLTVDHPGLFAAIEQPLPRVTTLRYRQDSPLLVQPLTVALVVTLTAAARVLPNVELLAISHLYARDLVLQLREVAEAAPRLFPRLRTIQIPADFLRGNDKLRDDLVATGRFALR
jgi:hypothetical protein